MQSITVHIPLPSLVQDEKEIHSVTRAGVERVTLERTTVGCEYFNATQQRQVFHAAANIGQAAPTAIISFFADLLMNTRLADFTQDDKDSKKHWRDIVNDGLSSLGFKKDNLPSSFNPIQSWIRFCLRHNLIAGLMLDGEETPTVMSSYALQQAYRKEKAKQKAHAEYVAKQQAAAEQERQLRAA